MIDMTAVTDRVILGAVLALILYNVAACLIGGGEATISARMQHHAASYPAIPMLAGALVAHLFWPVFGVRR